jgi:hypothetical protein
MPGATLACAMRTASWLSLLALFARLATGEVAPRNVQLSSGGRLRFEIRGNRTLVEWTGRYKNEPRQQLLLPRDADVDSGSPVLHAELVGEKAGKVYIVTNSYRSRPGPMSYCQSGEERYIRVLVRGSRLRETFSLKVQSCRENLEVSGEGIRWDSAASRLSIDSRGPRAQAARSYRVDAQGAVTALSTRP